MFGLFKKKKNRNFDCPMCGCEYFIQLDPPEITDFDSYEFQAESALIGHEECKFCKLTMAIVLTTEGEIQTIDENWAKTEQNYYKKSEPIEDEISDLEHELIENPDNKQARAKLRSLRTKMRRLEESFKRKEERYQERQSNWEDKWEDKKSRARRR